MIPRGRFVPAAGGGSVAPWVSFAGGAPSTNYLSGFGQTNSPGFTFAARLRFDETPANLDYLLGMNYAGMFHESDTSFTAAFNTTTFSNLDFSVDDPTTTFANTDIIALMLVIDTSGSMSGSATGRIYINGVEESAVTTAVSGNVKYNEGGNELIVMNSNGGGNSAAVSTNGIWMGTGALDPVTNWSNFFDGSNQWQNLTGDGTVGGVTPFFWQNGDATAWNSGSDNNGNSYTMNGSVT